MSETAYCYGLYVILIGSFVKPSSVFCIGSLIMRISNEGAKMRNLLFSFRPSLFVLRIVSSPSGWSWSIDHNRKLRGWIVPVYSTGHHFSTFFKWWTQLLTFRLSRTVSTYGVTRRTVNSRSLAWHLASYLSPHQEPWVTHGQATYVEEVVIFDVSLH